ncbi:cytoplasmic protein [Alkalilimnicola ehrlichii]|uniref:Cytoplasmic protein n=1 Tax=Alkalilimnicola ehrlichii TaxID=351052 RepID=A0A3E0WR14_9GAMM|nr:cytoplasmic protein [Alkalilimnicola ehrlichii]RFA27330.1 cytoplasmic protein [Alkalilimnicola ehrlichii]RFA34437.1 cytoplasmic protein [Alkalilimnicola ehrlichii]
MTAYRLVIWRNDRLLGQFETEVPWAREAIRDMLKRLPTNEGYRVKAFIAHDEQRILASAQAGMKLLGRELIFQELPLARLSSNCQDRE